MKIKEVEKLISACEVDFEELKESIYRNPYDASEVMKPIALFDYQIKNNIKGGDLVLDSFGGSGTTLMACEQNGKNALIMELDPKYVDVIINRWEEFTGKKAELIEEA